MEGRSFDAGAGAKLLAATRSRTCVQPRDGGEAASTADARGSGFPAPHSDGPLARGRGGRGGGHRQILRFA
eukprot:2306102-Prymnesium_polylepis.1